MSSPSSLHLHIPDHMKSEAHVSRSEGSSTPRAGSPASSSIHKGSYPGSHGTPPLVNTIISTPSTPSYTPDNPHPHLLNEGDNAQPLDIIGATATDKLVIIMVGLPATGKTHTANRIQRFLNFFHDIPSEIFNVGEYRRELSGAQCPAAFYSSGNPEGVKAREKAATMAMDDLITYMRKDGVRVGVLDATNSTYERRISVKERLKASGLGVKIMCIELICNDCALLAENIRTVKLNTPDYRDVEQEVAIKDFNERRENYKKQYTPLRDRDGSYIVSEDCSKFVINKIRGYLPMKVAHFVMNLHTLPRVFYFSRHGQSQYNLKGKIGGDSSLTNNGVEYSRRLGVFSQHVVTGRNPRETGDLPNKEEFEKMMAGETLPKPESEQLAARLWTSTMCRTKETANFIPHPSVTAQTDDGAPYDWVQMRPMARRNLDELYAGSCDGMTYKEIEEVFPNEFRARQNDKLAYRYSRGESYMDVIARLEPLAHEMERTREPLLIIGHQGILRIIYAYFMGLDRKDAPYVSIPLNTVIKLQPHAYGCHEERICLMSKDEMQTDGQDEPPTSMPRKAGESDDAVMNAPSC